MVSASSIFARFCTRQRDAAHDLTNGVHLHIDTMKVLLIQGMDLDWVSRHGKGVDVSAAGNLVIGNIVPVFIRLSGQIAIQLIDDKAGANKSIPIIILVCTFQLIGTTTD